MAVWSVGLGRLTQFVARRDRWRLMLWGVGLVAVQVISALSLRDLYADEAAVRGYARLFGDNPALVVFAGPGHGLDDPTIGAILVNETQLWGAIALGLMSVFMIVRGTRAEEDSERHELLGSSVVGRHAPATATVLVIGGVQAGIALASAVGFVATGFGAVGSLALAGSMLVVGWVMIGVAMICAQIFGSARTALSAASLILVVAFILRAIGDVTGTAVVWLSPIGWAQGVRAFAGERWWTLGLSVGVAGSLVVASFAAAVRRDLGAGMIRSGAGPARASGLLMRPIGMVLRLQRGLILGWSIGMLLVGLVFGSIADEVESMFADQPQLADFFAQLEGVSLTDAYLATSGVFIGLLAGGYAVASVLTLYTEERAGRAEVLWAAPFHRRGWLSRYLLVMALGSLWMLLLGGVGLGLAHAIGSDDASQMWAALPVALCLAPAVWALAGIAAALWALRPEWSLWAWAPVTLAVLVGYFAELLRLPTWVRWMSPFEHLAAVPAEPFEWNRAVWLTVLSAVMMWLARWGVSRRDLASR